MKKFENKNIIKASILITNYNKSKYLKKCLSSCNNQTYERKEIFIFDDCSTDNSLKIIKSFKKIKIFKNRSKKYTSGPLNQIYGLKTISKKSKGDIIFLMDGDDYFSKNKLSIIIKKFIKNVHLNFVQDTPKFLKGSKIVNIKKKRSFFTIWPKFYPTSCISMRRIFFSSFLKYDINNKFSNLEIDARISIYAYLKNEFLICNNKLTNYQYDSLGITSRYGKFSKMWWKKRKDAFAYTEYLSKKLNKKFKKGPDYYLTILINSFFSKF